MPSIELTSEAQIAINRYLRTWLLAIGGILTVIGGIVGYGATSAIKASGVIAIQQAKQEAALDRSSHFGDTAQTLEHLQTKAQTLFEIQLLLTEQIKSRSRELEREIERVPSFVAQIDEIESDLPLLVTFAKEHARNTAEIAERIADNEQFAAAVAQRMPLSSDIQKSISELRKEFLEELQASDELAIAELELLRSDRVKFFEVLRDELELSPVQISKLKSLSIEELLMLISTGVGGGVAGSSVVGLFGKRKEKARSRSRKRSRSKST